MLHGSKKIPGSSRGRALRFFVAGRRGWKQVGFFLHNDQADEAGVSGWLRADWLYRPAESKSFLAEQVLDKFITGKKGLRKSQSSRGSVDAMGRVFNSGM